MAGRNSAGKRKTLYGRYDDYGHSGGSSGGDSVGGTEVVGRSVRLSDIPVARNIRHGGRNPRRKADPTPVSAQADTGNGGQCPGETAAADSEKDAEVCFGRVIGISADADGETVIVSVEAAGDGGTPVRRRIPLMPEQYVSLGVHTGTLSEEEIERLERAGRLCLAIRKAAELLQYGGMSGRTLVSKMTARGIDRTVAEEAADWLTGRGLLREGDSARARAVEGARKGWGPRRIRQDLTAHGYPSEIADAAMDMLNDPDDPAYTDFDAACRSVLRVKLRGNAALLEDRSSRARLTAAMMRLGYDADRIRRAMSDAAYGKNS